MSEQEALRATTDMLDGGEDPKAVLALCRDAMAIVGKRFETGEYFLPELVLAGEMLAQIADMVKPRLRAKGTAEAGTAGKVVIGTVQGDVHDIGKNIVVFMLEVNGFDVHDLGIDVPAMRFVDEIQEFKPTIVGLSGFMTVAFEAMKETIAEIERAGLRDRVRIMIGGGMVDENIREYTGANAYGADAMAAVSLARGWMRGE